jgi:hypothetical protein
VLLSDFLPDKTLFSQLLLGTPDPAHIIRQQLSEIHPGCFLEFFKIISCKKSPAIYAGLFFI